MHPLVLRSERLARAGFVHGFSTRWASPGGDEGPSPGGDEHLRGFPGALGREVASAVRGKQVHGAAVLASAASGDTSFSEWEMDVTFKGGARYKLAQVAVRTWKDGQVVRERFYYNKGN